MNIKDRFLEYALIPTNSDGASASFPSTDKQKVLLELLEKQCREAGLSDVRYDGAYVYAKLPANADGFPRIGYIAHVDTVADMPDENINPHVVENYDGSDIVLNPELGITMKVSDFPNLKNYIGEDLIVTDGTTLLGADDKAGIAEILDAVIKVKESGRPHGDICIAFTPDEEISRGVDGFDVPSFGADYAYTVDGGRLGELECETFNAAGANIVISGVSIHPGTSKNKMINAARIAVEIDSLLPQFERPEHTEGYEGFYHLNCIDAGIEKATMNYIIRDHDWDIFQKRKQHMQEVCDFVNARHGKKIVELSMYDSYYNMKEKIEEFPEIVDRMKEAMKREGVEPIVIPIRGGTDGARLSFMGLPCPNICTGGENFHGKFEFISVQRMEKISDIIVRSLTDRELFS